jgi:antitoxin component YwqK of YwqJK toxin-antitoxin module
MNLKTLLLVLLIGTIQHSFGQKVNLLTLKVENGKYLNGNNSYNGLVYELYASGFLKSESAVKNGVYNGLVKKYIDNTKSISTYQDSAIIKIYDDTLSYLSKRLFQLYKDSANYSSTIKRIFDEEIKTSEKLDEWMQKYDEGKLRGNKLEIYTELRNASLGLDASMTNLKLVRQNNLYFQKERKTEKNKPVYTNILSEMYTYVDGNQSGIHITYKKGGEKDVEETLDNGKKNGPYKRYSGSKIVEEGNYVNNEKEGEWTTLNSSEKIFQTYSKGKLNGPFKKYDGEVLRESGQYIDGLKNGEWNYFNRLNELVLLETYKSNLLNGLYKKYSDDAGKDKIVFNNPEDEFNVSKEFLDLLIHLKFFVGTISNKYLYVNKVKDGIAYIESSHYNKEEKDLINLEIDKWVFSDYISTDKRTEDLSYDFGVDTDWSDLHPKEKKPNLWDHVIEEGTYSNGLKNGKFEFHTEDGTTRNTTYVNDVISKMTISCPELTSELLKLPPCIVNISINDDLSVQYQAIEFLIKGDNYLKQGDHEKAIYAYRDGIKKYRFQVLFDRIVPLGDYCYQQKHSGHVQDAYEQYLLTKQDGIRQNKFNECKANSDKFLSEFYSDAEEIVDAMNGEVKRRNSINNEVENRTNSSNSNQNDNESCSKCQGSGKCIECGKPQKVKYYKNGWKNDEEVRLGKTVCTACQGDGITDEHISGGKMDDYKNCYVGVCSNGWIKCRKCNGTGKCDKCHGSGKDD